MNILAQYFHDTKDRPAALAARAGCAPSTITRLLKGERAASAALAQAIETATDSKVKAIDILGMALEPQASSTDADAAA